MKNSQTVIRSILGTADVDIRPLAYAVDAAVELMFRQGIPEDDIAVTKELCYAIKSTGIIALSHMREQSLSVLYMAEFSAIPCTRSLCL